MKQTALFGAIVLGVHLACATARADSPGAAMDAQDLDAIAQSPLRMPLRLSVSDSLSWPDKAQPETADATQPETADAPQAVWPPATRKDFLAAVWPHAERVAREIGVTPHALVAQAALESAWGRRTIGADGQPTFNLFGIKAGRAWTGDRSQVATHEYVHGKARLMYADFRAYESIGDAFDDYLRMLRANPRYATALRHGGTSRHFAARLQRAGYSTDPRYAVKIHRIANSDLLRSHQRRRAG